MVDEEKGKRFLCCAVTVEKMMRGTSEGFRGYIFLVKRLVWVFLGMSLIACTALSNNLTSSFYDTDDMVFKLEKTTLGNVDGFNTKMQFEYEAKNALENSKMSGYISIAADFLYSIFFLFCILYSFYMIRVDRFHQKGRPVHKVRDFTIQMYSIDKEYSGLIEEDAKMHFQQLIGDVVEVSVIKRTGNLLSKYIDL